MPDEPAAPETDPANPTDPPKPDDKPTIEPPAAADKDAEIEKWKSLARKNEDKAKANANAAKELEKLQASQMTENEKAVAAALEQGKAEGSAAGAQRLAKAEIKAALTGIVPDPTAVLDDIDLAKYIGADGDVDTDKVSALAEKWKGLVGPAATPPPPGVPKGARETTGVKQLAKADLKTMSSAEIVAARKAGQLNDLMSGQT